MTTAEGELSIDAAESADGAASVTLGGRDSETRFGGSASLADVPGWVPVYPRGSDTQSAFQTTSGETRSGAISSTTTAQCDRKALTPLCVKTLVQAA